MHLGIVTGTVVSTRRTSSAEGWSFRVVEKLNVYNQPAGQYAVAVNAVGAGPGEVVMITHGSAARQTNLTASRPCDAIIFAIVDTWELGGEVQYVKDTAPVPDDDVWALPSPEV